MTHRIERCMDAACHEMNGKGPGVVFFRADDVAVPGKRLFQLIALFIKYRVPLALAVVPAWLTAPRWESLKRCDQKESGLLCWHQHGWRHMNHEKSGRKQEFGPERSISRIRQDLSKGKVRLETLMGRSFYPVFTPPLESLQSAHPKASD